MDKDEPDEEEKAEHQENLLGTCTEIVHDYPEEKEETFCNSVTSTCVLLETDDIPLIDEVLSGDVPPEAALASCIRPESWWIDHSTKAIPNRRSVVSYDPHRYTPVPTTLPPKKGILLSPDVFQLRAPLVSWENFMTPAGSVEIIIPLTDTDQQH